MSSDIAGVILLDKPVGVSSQFAVNFVRRALGAKKAGHTGTLDKMASGMLPVCLGEATKFAGYAINANKSYAVKMLFGFKSSTGDMEGDCCQVCDRYISQPILADCLQHFLGKIKQVPPMYSALKQQGKPLYKLARQGKTVARPAREIEIYDLRIIDYSWPWVTLGIECSKGTYVRVLAEDIAAKVNSCAYLVQLHRTWVGNFADTRMLSCAEVDIDNIIPMQRLLAHLPMIKLTNEQANLIKLGQRICYPGVNIDRLALYDSAGLIGVGQLEDGLLLPKRLIAQN